MIAKARRAATTTIFFGRFFDFGVVLHRIEKINNKRLKMKKKKKRKIS